MCPRLRAVAVKALILASKPYAMQLFDSKPYITDSIYDILQFVKEHGLEADRSSLRHLFSVINFSDLVPSVTVQLQAKLLGIQLERQLHSSSFVSNICYAFDQFFASNQKVS